MKKLIPGIALLLILLPGCLYISNQAEPEKLYNADTIQSAGLEKFAHREASEYGFRLLFLPISVPKPIDMVDEMVVGNRAVGVTNLSVETSEFNALVFQIPKVTVRADLLRKKQ